MTHSSKNRTRRAPRALLQTVYFLIRNLNPESPAFYPAFPGGFDFDEPFDPPAEHQELLPLSELTSSLSSPSSDSELTAEQLLIPSQSLTSNPTIVSPAQVPTQNTSVAPLLNSASVRIMSGARDMPLRGSNKAPKFSSRTEDITRYLKDVE
ncbi:hypothetical protein M404DRAFT_35857 [Pisolithus tinctorius Marx 270]|uniref:Uncharacterized protein n=1 Tax=Pisolithus tinctorius Marx 270 TaxID=870435 RepID=A0A0C3J7M1_PISTI|nr:hypothetical protein M404DRAFT_35857 [Pisolithus tinctorius Marx 270]